jgi:hypothetical protein
MTDEATRTGETSRNAAGRRTRRQLLAGGTGALAAVLAAEAIARPTPALAADGDNVVLGQDNAASATTVIANSADDKTQAALQATGTGETIGISGLSDSGNGVYGQSGATPSGLLSAGHGVHGITDDPQGYGVVAEHYGNGTAIIGIGGELGSGVTGTSGVGVGVSGSSGGQAGVAGANTGAGPGVYGSAFSGIGVLASGATALSVQGPAVFSRSGVLTVHGGRSSAVQTVIQLSAATLVLATIQDDVEGVWVRSAVPDPAGHKFTIHLNKAAPTRVRVAWFLVN